MKTLAILAQKGGAGKTTLAVHWSVIADRSRSTVVLLDADKQSSATKWFERREAETPLLVPVQPARPDAPTLKDALAACRRDGVDLAIVDTAPHAEEPAVDAARLADLVVIPTRPAILDLEAISATVEIVQSVGTKAVIVLNACPPRSPVTEDAREALKQYGLQVCPTPIVQRVALQYALNDGRAIIEYDNEAKAAVEMAAVLRWILRRL